MKVCRILLVLIMVVRVTGSAKGQTPYKLPPRDVVAILDAPQPPIPFLSPTRDSLLLVDIRYYPSIAELAEPVLRLAGVRINPRIGCTQRRCVQRPYRQPAGRFARAGSTCRAVRRSACQAGHMRQENRLFPGPGQPGAALDGRRGNGQGKGNSGCTSERCAGQ